MSTHYTAGSMPLAFMQEDFLVLIIYLTKVKIDYNLGEKYINKTCSLLAITVNRVLAIDIYVPSIAVISLNKIE